MSIAPSAPGRPYAAVASRVFTVLCAMCMLICLGTLALLLGNIFSYGWERVSLDFITRYPSANTRPKAARIRKMALRPVPDCVSRPAS